MTTSGSGISVLVIDDEPAILELAMSVLEQLDIEALGTTDPEKGLEIVRRRTPRAVLLDLAMPKISGLELLDRIVEADPRTDVIVVSGNDDPEVAAEAIKRGAADYLSKPLSVQRLRERLQNVVAEHRRRQKASHLDKELIDAFSFEGIVGRSPLMLEVFESIRRIGPHFQTALVTGDTGTGKELVARALHRRSPVSQGPFVPCNCSAIVETLFESELFGHVKGAFTGATGDKVGLFEHADQGVMFLDEIGDMPLSLQSKLLRVLEDREVRRVGSTTGRKVNVRVLGATNRNLAEMMAEGKFRKDLYHRLSVFEIRLPKLSQRREDLPLLIRHFVEKFGSQQNKRVTGLTRRAQTLLTRYPWPGNVRELENVICHAGVMSQQEFIDWDALPERLRAPGNWAGTEDDDDLSLEGAERRHVQRVLELVDGNRAEAARILGIGRTTLYRMLGSSPEDEK